jgi:hypothetical protein
MSGIFIANISMIDTSFQDQEEKDNFETLVLTVLSLSTETFSDLVRSIGINTIKGINATM